MTPSRSLPSLRSTSPTEALVRTHLGLVDSVAKRYRRHSQLDDMVGAGRLGLVLAARSFDPTRGVPFEMFARVRIRGAMLDHLRSWGHLPTRVHRRAVRDGDPIIKAPVDIDAVQIAGHADPERDYARAERRARLEAGLRTLAPAARSLIRTVYFDGRSLKDAARSLGFSKSWGSRVAERGVRQLTKFVAFERRSLSSTRPTVGKPMRLGSSRTSLGLGSRARTENVSRLPKRELDAGRVHLDVVVERPKTRGDCENTERPCVFVGCVYNTYLDVDEANGSIKYHFPDREPGDVEPERSCALDIADRGGGTLADIGQLTNVTHERIRQIESNAIELLQKRGSRPTTDAGILREFCDRPDATAKRDAGQGGGSVLLVESQPDTTEGEERGQELTGVSFFADGEGAEAHVCRSVWTMFTRWQNTRGFSVTSKEAAAARAAKTPWRKERAAEEGERSMANEEDLTPRLKGVLHAWRDLSKDGAKPAALDVAKRARIEGVDDAKRTQIVYWAVAQLRKLGHIEYAHASTKATPPPKAPRKARVVNAGGRHTLTPARAAGRRILAGASLAAEQKPSRAASTDPTVASLIIRRDDFRRKADALDVAIEALSVAL